MARSMTPVPTRTYVDGPSLTDDAALLDWLEASRGKALRLPVAVTFDDAYRLAIETAHVGGVPLQLDDTAMAVAVLDQVRELCPADQPGCTVWLEGTWGAVLQGVTMPMVPGPGLAGPDLPGNPGPARHPFAVRKVGGIVEGGPVTPQIEG